MRKLCDIDEVRKCLDEVTGDDAIYAKGLLEWAIKKRTVDEADIRADEREKVIDEAISRISNLRDNEYDERDEAHNNGIDHAIAELELMKGENRIPRRHQYAR